MGDNSWLFGPSVLFCTNQTFLGVRALVVMNSFRIPLPATCQFRDIPSNVALVMWCGIQANQLDPVNVDTFYSLANSHCDLSQLEGSLLIIVGCLWDELIPSSIGFNHTIALLCAPISMLGSAGAPSQLCSIHQIN